LYSVAVLVVTAAVLFSLVRVFISDVEAYRLDIEHLASAFLDHPVKIESMDARLVGMTPTIIFNRVRLLDKTGKAELVSFEQAQLSVAILSSLREEKFVPKQLVVAGINLAITRNKTGDIQIQGLDIPQLDETALPLSSGQNNELAEWLFRRGNIALRDSSVIWKDLQRGGVTRQFDNINLQLMNKGKEHVLSGEISLPLQLGNQLEFVLDIEGDIQKPADWVGEFYLRGEAINLAEWQKELPKKKGFGVSSGILDVQLWGELQAGQLTQLSGDTTVHKVLAKAPFVRGTVDFRMLAGIFDYRANAGEQVLAVERLQVIRGNEVWPESRVSIHKHINKGDRPDEVEVLADQFRLQDISQLLLKTKFLPRSQHRRIEQMQAQGEVRNLNLQVKTKNDEFAAPFFLQAEFEQLAIRPSGKIPGINGVSGTVWTNAEQGQVNIHSGYASFDAPKLFRVPLKLQQLNGTLHWHKQPQGWQFLANDIQASNNDLKSVSSFQIDVPAADASPYLDLQVAFSEGNASQASPYYPVHIMSKPLVKWLDQAIVGGQIKSGGATFNGRLSDFPFKQPNGQFLVEFAGKNVELAYYPGWPRLSKAAANVKFTSKGMGITVTTARLFNSKVNKTTINIPNFALPQLEIDGSLKGSVNDVTRFLIESPLAPNAQEFVKQQRIEGTASTQLQFHIPLSKKMREQAPMGLQGETRISNGALYLLDEKLDITGINGVVHFTETEQTARDIQGFILGEPAVFNMTTEQVDAEAVINITATAQLDTAKLLDSISGGKSGKRIQGMSDWQGLVSLPYGKSSKKRTPVITFSSSLQGVSLDLPSPLNKQANDIRELLIRMQHIEPHESIFLNYGNHFCGVVLLSEMKLQQANLHFGSDCELQPEHDVLKLTGTVENFSVNEWQAVISDLFPQSKGEKLTLPIVLAMDRMQLKKLQDDDEAEQTLVPEDVPIINGEVKSLAYDGMEFGRFSITTSRMRKGIRLDSLQTAAPYLKLKAKGQWTQWLGRDKTTFDVQFNSPDAGKMVESLGFAAVIEKGELNAKASLNWPDRLDRFDAESMNGNLHLNIKKGNITEVEAGAGRLLGLFSLYALPRRLALDFRDTFKSGFQFDEINGDFEFREGNAYTENLHTKSPVAQIMVKGRTGFVEQDFDQKVTVTPKVSGTLPVAGGLLFGLEVGAAIILLDKLLGDEINKATSREYHVTGSWDEPLITQIGGQFEEQGFQDDEI
jgi:uncharacterized protein (TIGR02099 family)